MKIVVLAGGTSTERDVSIVSGKMVCQALREKNHEAILLDVYFGNADIDVEDAFGGEYDVEKSVSYITSFNNQVAESVALQRDFFGPNVLKLCKAADIVFLALHGENGENGKVQAAFDLFNIKYTGSGYLSSAMAMDKGLTKKLFRANNVPCPAGITLERGTKDTDLAASGVVFPVVVKPCCGGSSVGVYIVNNQQEYEKALEEAFSYEDEVVVEQYIKGREFSVAVIAGEAYPVIEIAPLEGFYDYKNKYSQGAAVETCPADLTPAQSKEMQEYALRGVEALFIEGYSRLDFMMDRDGKMYCLEANTLPGMTPTSLLPQEAGALGIGYPELCEKLIKVSLQKYNSGKVSED